VTRDIHTAHRGDIPVLAVVPVNNNDRSFKLALPKSVSIGVPVTDIRMFSYSQTVSISGYCDLVREQGTYPFEVTMHLLSCINISDWETK
jgi:hypothetical protein